MQEHDMPDGGATDRRVQLRAAAEALVAWVHAQRGTSTRTSDLLGAIAPPAPVRDAVVAVTVPSVAATAAADVEMLPQEAGTQSQPERKPQVPPWLWPWITGHARALGPLLFGLWSWIAGHARALGPLLLGLWSWIIGRARALGLAFLALSRWLVGHAGALVPALLRPWPLIVGRTSAFLAPLLRWSWRLGAAAALAAVVLAGGIRAWPYARDHWPAVQTSAGSYWLKLTTALKSGTEVPVPPDPDEAAGVRSPGRGGLQVQSDPVGARVFVDGTPRGVTPLTLGDLRPGSHVVVLESAKGSISRTVDIVAGRTVRMSEGIFGGWVHVSTPFEILITEGSRGMRLDGRNEILLAPGTHTLVFENRDLGYREERQIEVSPGATTDVSLAPPPAKLSVTATLAAEVLIDGQRAGLVPLVDYDVPLGTRDIVVRSEAGAERRFTVTMTTKPARIDVDFSKP